MIIPIRSRKRPAKIGEDIRNCGRLIGYAVRVTKVGRNRWEIVIARGSR